ncbi:MAG: YceI family protein [Desulfarculus sp.]|nr:YceI family protein [Pseudomonadota bacterium]MBV1714636.1 YceI family protein [Desulfarculus sp.]MBU4576829.1 YceI family protein [Pseudomonadota bacterium]MBU4599972.1 YceI family protein [Pseudomonadota bacterium]MBV1740173.1 YceI family protein [Desulfarculus sp.]
MKTTRLIIALALLLGLSLPAMAAAPQWSFDPPHCQVIFTIKHVFAPVMGQFHKFDGKINFSPDDLAGSKVDMTIQVASIDTGVAARDNHLKSADFFDAAKYPVIRFVSDSFTKRGDSEYVVKGRLTMKDVTRPVEIVFTYLGTKPNPMNKDQMLTGLKGGFALERLDYHVGSGKYYQMGVVGNKVDMYIHLELVRDK